MAAVAACWPGCFGKDGMFGCGGKCLAPKSLHHFIQHSSKPRAKQIPGNHGNCLRHTGSAGCAEPLTREWVGWRRWSILCRRSVPHITTVPNSRRETAATESIKSQDMPVWMQMRRGTDTLCSHLVIQHMHTLCKFWPWSFVFQGVFLKISSC